MPFVPLHIIGVVTLKLTVGNGFTVTVAVPLTVPDPFASLNAVTV